MSLNAFSDAFYVSYFDNDVVVNGVCCSLTGGTLHRRRVEALHVERRVLGA